MTGFKTFGEFVRETSVEERALITSSIERYHEQMDGGGGGGGVGSVPSSLPPGV